MDGFPSNFACMFVLVHTKWKSKYILKIPKTYPTDGTYWFFGVLKFQKKSLGQSYELIWFKFFIYIYLRLNLKQMPTNIHPISLSLSQGGWGCSHPFINLLISLFGYNCMFISTSDIFWMPPPSYLTKLPLFIMIILKWSTHAVSWYWHIQQENITRCRWIP